MKTCYLLGYPVEHSMSAVMHNAAFKHLGLDYRYELLNVQPPNLEKIVNSFRDPSFGGANVTIPHKVEVMQHLDEVDVEAQRIGAVNTIVLNEDRLVGYNTDGRGAIKAITEVYGTVNGADVVILGAGGAARAIGYHLSLNAGRIQIFNRTEKRSRELADYLSGLPECNATVQSQEYTHEKLKTCIGDADILINATTVGMYPKIGVSPIDPELLGSHLLVFDSVYNPLKTRLLKDAENAGAETLSGLRMLVFQGVSAFELWTGLNPPGELMYQAARGRLSYE